MVGQPPVKPEPGEPAIGQVHPDVVQQPPFTGDPAEVADLQQTQEDLGVNRGAPGLAIKTLQPGADEAEIHVAIDQPEQVRLGDLILEAEVVEERLLAVLLTHHRERPPLLHHSRSRGERHMKSRFSTASLLFGRLLPIGPKGKIPLNYVYPT